MKALRVVIWLAITTAFLRGLMVFDGGPSADHHGTVAAGACFAAAIISAAIMYHADTRKA